MKYSLFLTIFSKTKSYLPQYSIRILSSKVPFKPIITLEKGQNEGVKIDRNTLALLERLSLVKYNTPEGVKVLEDSINFANKVLHIDTDGIEPLYSVLENEKKDKQAYDLLNLKWQSSPMEICHNKVTTTPSLFKIDDMQQECSEAKVNIVAQFPFGSVPVESISVSVSDNCSEYKNCSLLKCTMSLEGALFILMFDGCTNYSKDRYLKLHRKMAPYKFAIALDPEGVTNIKDLGELAALLQNKLQLNKIAVLLSDFSLPLNIQITETLQIGVPYTAILDKTTLENGIFKLLNSSTMLKEQVHVADFDSYAAVLCSGK